MQATIAMKISNKDKVIRMSGGKVLMLTSELHASRIYIKNQVKLYLYAGFCGKWHHGSAAL
jgi:hypothetical protein